MKAQDMTTDTVEEIRIAVENLREKERSGSASPKSVRLTFLVPGSLHTRFKTACYAKGLIVSDEIRALIENRIREFEMGQDHGAPDTIEEEVGWLENAIGHLCGQVTHLAYALEQTETFLPESRFLKHGDLIKTSRQIVRAIEDGEEWPRKQEEGGQ